MGALISENQGWYGLICNNPNNVKISDELWNLNIWDKKFYRGCLNADICLCKSDLPIQIQTTVQFLNANEILEGIG